METALEEGGRERRRKEEEREEEERGVKAHARKDLAFFLGRKGRTEEKKSLSHFCWSGQGRYFQRVGPFPPPPPLSVPTARAGGGPPWNRGKKGRRKKEGSLSLLRR